MERIVINPKSETCQKHNQKVDKYDVEEKDSGSFLVTNTENNNTHSVVLEKVSNLEFLGSCDCEDYQYRRKQSEEPCIHIYKVVFEANLNDSLNIPESGESKSEESQSQNKQIEERKKPQQLAKPQESKPAKQVVTGDVPIKHKGGYYSVQGKEIEDAWKAQNLANQYGVSTEVIEYGQDKEKAYAHVRGLIGEQFTETVVWHDFDIAKEDILWDKVKELQKYGKRVEFDEEGNPKLPPEEQAKVVQRFMNFRKFALRDAITKASRIVQLKLLNREFREEEEIGMEEQEVKQVNQ